MRNPFFTIGHSNRGIDEFTALLAAAEVDLVVDTRKLPGSARYPQFNQDVLTESLAAHGIRYRRMEALAGRRPKSTDVAPEVNAWWQNRSFHNYADYALSEPFRNAITELRTCGTTHRLAVMCSEAVWWRCHRRIIADHLLAAGEQVFHIVDSHQVTAAEPSAGAVVAGDDRSITYPATD